MFEVHSFEKEYKFFKKKINKSIAKVLKSKKYVLNSEVKKFEKNFANYIGTKYCVGVGSGTDAITIAILSSGIKRNDEIITSSFTAFPTITGILNSGAKPVLVDVNNEDALINVKNIIQME